MQRLMVFVFVIVVMMASAGCGQEAAPLPTLFPTGLPEQAATATTPPTEAPTSAPVVRPTLPPTWTPSPVPSVTPSLTPVPNTGLPAGKPTLEACATFRIDPGRYTPEFALGTDATVAWTQVATASAYRVVLINEFGDELFADDTTDTQYAINASLFEGNKRYGWNVHPLDSLAQQMCINVGGELFPR